jgi:putative permease
MKKVIGDWIDRYLGDQESVLLTSIIILSLIVILTMGPIIAPVLAALIIAFLLQGSVARFEKTPINHLWSVIIVFIFFIGLMLASLVILAPMVVKQATNLLAEIPSMIGQLQDTLKSLPEKYPELVSDAQVGSFMAHASGEVGRYAENLLAIFVSKVPNLMGLVVYLILVPLMVFFLLKDKQELIDSLGGILPKKRPVMLKISVEMNSQMANYVRGKVTEILVTGIATYITFAIMGVNYAALLGLLVGCSVVVPYIGAAVVTVPVAMVSYFQMGWGGDFFWVMAWYMIIQFLDCNVLVPLLFSEAVNLHPIAIIFAVLVFGGFWGFWGVFFAIPLATLVKAIYNAWPRSGQKENTFLIKESVETECSEAE